MKCCALLLGGREVFMTLFSVMWSALTSCWEIAAFICLIFSSSLSVFIPLKTMYFL